VNRRAMVLEELGLAPHWVLRNRADAPTPSVAPALPIGPLAAPAPVIEPAPAPVERAARIAVMDWAALKVAVSECTACRLHSGRTQAVFGVGDEAADWLFIGEGPGAEEDARGEPFVGQAGRLLDNMLAAIALKRGEDVYIANIVKCRPPGNRAPEPGETAACEGFLRRQIALLRPRLLIALGKTAANNLLKNDASIASLRGRVHECGGIPLIVTYHPAYLLRTLGDKAKAWEDLCFAYETMDRLKAQALAPT
jgi:uracil-DNA glycosylase